MSDAPLDISRTLTAKSDQLNSDDLLGGPITVQILAVKLLDGEQPVSIEISDGWKPWKPCKTMRRLLGHPETWGADASVWKGRWVTLYRDAEVEFGGAEVGGIRVSHMSHIRGNLTVSLTAKRGGKKKAWHVAKLTPPQPANGNTEITDAHLKGWCADAVKARGWTAEQVTALLGGKAADVPPEKRPEIVAKLKGPPPAAEPAPADDNVPF